MRARLLVLLAGAAAVLSVPHAAAQTLAELEQAARANAAAVRIAAEDARVQQHRLDAVDAQRGARFNAGVGLADTREPVTDTDVRSYRRGSAQVGVRWPLLEGVQQQERAQTDARGALEAARLRARQAEIDAVRELRMAYVDHLHARERLELARALLRFEPEAQPILAARTRQSFLLEADRRELQTIFDIARRDAERAGAARDDARARVRRASALPRAEPTLDAPRWDTGCVAAPALLARADERPVVALAALELATREALANQQRWTGVDAGVALTQSVSKDIGSLSGHSTGVSVDVSVPFGWRALRSARQGEADAAVRRARLQLDAAREADAASIDEAVRTVRVREADRQAAAQRLDAALEALRVAELRKRRLEGDVIEKVLQARHATYLVGVELSDAMQRLERAQADVLSVAAPCSAQGASIEPAAWGALPDLIGLPLGAGFAGASTSGVAPGRPAIAPPHDTGLGWYAWSAAPWLAQPAEMLARLPQGSVRVLLGVDAAQLRALAAPAGAQAMQTLISLAHQRGVRVELLLGDPGWVLPAGGARLVAMLQPIATLPFDGVHLDLERDQLPQRERRAWASGVVATVSAVHATVPWPIALTTHDRDLRDARTNARLRDAGLAELTPLVYVTRRDAALARVRAVLAAAPPPLRVSVGQSVERGLPAESSSHARGRVATLAQLDALAHALGDEARFAGVIVQSFEEFQGAPP